MYTKLSYKSHKIADTQFRVTANVYDFLGQPSYITFIYKIQTNQSSIISNHYCNM